MDATSGSPLLQMRNLKGNNEVVAEKNHFRKQISARSDLIRAVRRGIRITEKYLDDLEKGIDALNITDTDQTGKNVFHLSVQREDLLEFLLEKFKKHPLLKEALTSEDVNGHTPAHLATLNNTRKSVQLLGAVDETSFDVRSKLTGKTLIHCAVESGCVYMVQYLLQQRPDALFDKDENLRAPQHYAAALKESIVLEFLLSHGVDITETDSTGYSALHIAAEAGSISNVKLLVQDDEELLTMTDTSGQTALHVACNSGHRNIVSFLLDSGADPLERITDGCTALGCAIKNKQQGAVEELLLRESWKELINEYSGGPKKCFSQLVAKMPQAATTLLDRCITRSEESPKSADYFVTYDFSLIAPSGPHPPKFEGLSAILEYDREECLLHPICKKYFSIKWKRKGYKLYIANLIIYLIFHFLFNSYVMNIRGAIARQTVQTPGVVSRRYNRTLPGPTLQPASDYPEPNARPDDTGPLISTAVIVTFTALNLLKEVFQMYLGGLKYFKHVANYSELILYLSVLLFMFPVNNTKTVLQFGFGSIAIFISWFNLIWFLRRLPDVGTYILALQKVFKTLIKMLTLISLFCVAFATTFYIQLAEYDRYRNFQISIISTFVSMLGDYSYDELFVQEGYHPSFYYFKLSAFVFFLLLMGVVVNNVLIGLAVGDTDYVIRQAKVQRLKQQAKYIMEIETSVINRISCLKMPMENVYTEYPNRQKTCFEKFGSMLKGDSNMWGEEDESDEEEEDKGISEDRVEEIVKARLQVYHKQIIQELKDLRVDIMNEITRTVE